MITAPNFWTNKGLISTVLLPLSLIWVLAGQLRRMLAKTEVATLPVICVGNILIGGSGKTPVTATLCGMLKEQGYTPCILTRGYKGNNKGPVFADPAIHTTDDVGDEAIMLAFSNDVCVSADRIKGAAFISAQNKFDVIIMDDGMQNPWLHKDIILTVFDGGAGAGNRRLLPAGPLREPLNTGLARADAAILNGQDETGLFALLPKTLPQFKGKLYPDQKEVKALGEKRFIAFAGIGRPKRFFETVTSTGADVVRTLSFADHHSYSEADLSRLQQEAWTKGADLITTQKDWVRLPPDWRAQISTLPVTFRFSQNDQSALLKLITAVLPERRS
ncbi:MAG: tetraacyldisaccharide 4'-kinase [Rhodospirillaceae bacterium]|nr:tetraacyldisaccharide 4'-kinase [Rhodospirillaceae bacterium]